MRHEGRGGRGEGKEEVDRKVMMRLMRWDAVMREDGVGWWKVMILTYYREVVTLVRWDVGVVSSWKSRNLVLSSYGDDSQSPFKSINPNLFILIYRKYFHCKKCILALECLYENLQQHDNGCKKMQIIRFDVYNDDEYETCSGVFYAGIKFIKQSHNENIQSTYWMWVFTREDYQEIVYG